MKQVLILIQIILFSGYVFSQTPIASYPFNGNANDAVGSNNGTVNGATLTTDRFGNANSAYSFDGVDDNISINHNAVFNLNNYSISVWFKYNGAGTAGKLYWDLISKNSDGIGFNEPFHLFVNASDKASKARVGTGGTEFGLGNTSSIDNGIWHQSVLVFDNVNDAVKLFVDGILISTVTNTANPITNTANIKIGFWEAYNNFFNGAIDDIKIYNTPLTDIQIQADYNQSIGLIASYPFNANANDAVGTNHGTVNGATLTTDRFGNANSAYSFDGVDDFISTANLATNQTDNWTMTAWVKPTSISQQNGTIVLNGFDNGISGNGYAMVMGDPSNNANGNLFKGLLSGVAFVNSGLSFNINNTWYHIAIVREAGITKLYLNGVLSGTTSAVVPNVPSGSLNIGSASGLRFWNGSIDEVKIYNTALSPAQVLGEYTATSNNGLVAFYPFNGNANDAIGTNHGTVNGASLTSDRNGIANKAYSFDGINDKITAPLSVTATDNFSMSGWVKLNNLGTNQMLFYNGNSSLNGYGLYLSSNGILNVLHGALNIYPSTAILSINQWHFLAMVRHAGNTKVYVNGNEVFNATTSTPNTPNDLFYMSSNTIGTEFFNGIMDDVKMYNTAISASQIQTEYSNSLPSLIAYYTFNNSAADSSGNSLHGTIVGSPSFTTDRNGNANSAISFNGNVANCIEVDDNMLLHMPSITIGAWVKLNSLGSIKTIVDKPLGSNISDSWHFGTENSNLSCWHFNNTNTNPYTQVTSPTSTNQWYYVVNTFDDVSKQHKLYVDGILKATNTFNSTIGYDNSKMYIGAAIENGGLNFPMDGEIDEVKIYGSALTASQILNDYKSEVAANKPGSGHAISFDGINDYVQLPSVLDGATQFTVDFWIKTTENRSSGTYWQKPSILGNGNPSGPDGDFGISTSNGFIGVWHGFCCGDQSFETTKAINDNHWHHVAAVNDGSNVVLFVDGIQQAGSIPTGGGALQNAARPWRLGMINSCCPGDTPHQGTLDELRMWNIALTQTQIRDRMCKKIVSTDALYSNLSAYFNFDETAGSSTFDASANGHTSTLHNGASRIISGAPIGNTSSHDYSGASSSTTLANPTRGDDVTITLTSGAAQGVHVYNVKESPNSRDGVEGLETNDGYFGTFVVGGSSPTFNTIYNYDGIPNISDENALSLFSRTDNSATAWTGELAAINTSTNTLTKNGIVASQKEFIIGANDPGNISANQNSCFSIIPNPLTGTSAYNGALGVTYQWQDSTLGGIWQNISGATIATPLILPLISSPKYYRRLATFGSLTLSSNIVFLDIKNAIAPNIITTNQWNLYAYDGTSVDSLNITYKGSYTRNTLGINTINDYGSGNNPSTSAGYAGCSLSAPNNTYSLYAKRKGFPIGSYALNIPQHDDELKIYKDGVLVTSAACCNNMGSQYFTLTTLDANSVIECRIANSGGGPGHMVIDIFIQNLTGGTIGNNQSHCEAFTPNILNNIHPAYGGSSSNISYQWQESNDNINFTNINGATSLTYQPTLVSTDKYFRRKAINANNEEGFSNVIFIDINGTTFYADNDGDGFGDPNNTVQACSMPNGYINNNNDCNDNDILERPNQIWYIDADGDGFSKGSAIQQCSRPSNGFVFSELTSINTDCNDNHNHIHPGAQYVTYSGAPNYTNNIVYPLTGDPFTNYRYEVMYFNIYNELPENGAPRLSVDFNQDFILDLIDKRVTMLPDDVNDLNTQDGKKYYMNITGLQPGIPIQSYVSPHLINCDYFGPFTNSPQVLTSPNLSILAQDITFSNYTPSVSSPITVSATIKNESDFQATNFTVKLVNMFDTSISYPINTVAFVPAHSTTTVTWNITTPAIASLCPMKVIVDFNNTIIETNEFDNVAIRGFANGGGSAQGGINVITQVSPSTVFILPGQTGTVNLTGQAIYTGLANPLINASVSGAQVTCTIIETGQTFTGNTDAQGNFSIAINTPVGLGVYHISGTVYDFTWTGSFAGTNNQFEVLDAVIVQGNNLPQLQPILSIASSTILVGNSITSNYSVSNVGTTGVASPFKTKLIITGPNNFLIQDSTSTAFLNVGSTTNASSLTSGILNTPGTYYFTLIADVDENIQESAENDNSQTIAITVLAPVVDLVADVASTIPIVCNNQIVVSATIQNVGSIPSNASQAVIRLKENGLVIDTALIPMAAINANESFPISHTFTPSFTPHHFTFEVVADRFNTNVESSELNNVSTVQIFVDTCKPDLKMADECTAVTIEALNNDYSGSVTLKAFITNVGDRKLQQPLTIRFDFMNGTFYDQVLNTPLDISNSTTVQTTIPSLPIGATQLKVIIDPMNAVTEKNETDNESSVKALGKDYSPTNSGCTASIPQYNYHVGGFFHLYSPILSNNLFKTDSLTINFKISGPGIVGIQNLGDAKLYNVNPTCVCPAVASIPTVYLISQQGTYHIYVTTDPNNEILETNETNNVLDIAILVQDKSDMVMTSSFINPSNLNPIAGQSITTQVTYENIGNENLNDTMKLKLIIDNVVVDSISNASGLIQNGKATVNFTTPWSSIQPGVHLMRAIIDADNIIDELNETNNESVRPIIVGDAANMHFASLTASHLYPSLHDSISILANIANNGALNCSSQVNFYFTNNLNDTIAFKSIPVTVLGNSSKPISFKWKVLDEQTTIYAVIKNSSAQEFDYSDNVSSFQLGKMKLIFETEPACFAGNTGKLFAGILGGNAPYSYQWNTGSTGSTLQDTVGNYSVTVTDATGQTTSDASSIVACLTIVQLNCFLQGYYSGSASMTDVLFNQGRINLHTHTDTLIVDLRNAITHELEYSVQGILKTDGSMKVYFPLEAIGNNYFVVIKHRNSIETWSAIPIAISALTLYNFTTAASQAYGANQLEIEPGVFVIYTGDIDQDGSITTNDYAIWENDANNFASGYLSTDLDGDGGVTTSDYSIWEVNSTNFVGVVKP